MNGRDKARQTRTNAMIADMEQTIGEAKETTQRMDAVLAEVGVSDRRSLEKMLTGAQCSPALRTMLEADRERIEKEMSDGVRELAGQSRSGPHHPRRRRRALRKI